MQETLRIHPPIVETPRVVWDDDIIPLSKPVVGVSGKVYRELTIPRGTEVVIPSSGHNLWAIPWAYRLSTFTYLM